MVSPLSEPALVGQDPAVKGGFLLCGQMQLTDTNELYILKIIQNATGTAGAKNTI